MRAIQCYWLLAVSHWLACGNPTLLRLGNSNEFDYTRLNRSVSWLRRTESLGKLRKLANLGKILLKLTNFLNLSTVYFANG